MAGKKGRSSGMTPLLREVILSRRNVIRPGKFVINNDTKKLSCGVDPGDRNVVYKIGRMSRLMEILDLEKKIKLVLEWFKDNLFAFNHIETRASSEFRVWISVAGLGLE